VRPTGQAEPSGGRRNFALRLVLMLLLFALAAVVTWQAVMRPRGAPPRAQLPRPENGGTAGPPAVPKVPPKPKVGAPDPPAANKTPPEVVPVPKLEDPPGPDPKTALQELDGILERRDRALQSGNFAAARAALTALPRLRLTGEAARKAATAADETEKVIADAAAKLLQDAERAAAARDYRTAAAKCTRLLSSDPQGKPAEAARALMEKLDQQAEARYRQVSAAGDKALAASQLDEALRVLSAGLDELGGTRWAEPLTARQLQLVLAAKFLKECEKARAQRTVPVNLSVQDAQGHFVSAVLREIAGLNLKVEVRGVTLLVRLGGLALDDWHALVRQLGREQQHLGLANLYTVLQKTALARQEMDRALRVPDQAAEAARLAAAQGGTANLRVYDFSQWQHQGDWEAPSGVWSTQNGQYVLESPEGGDTTLKPQALGGPLRARQARISSEFTPGQFREGCYIAAEFGNEKRSVTVVFTSRGYELQAGAGEKARGAWSPGPTRVELAFGDDTVAVNLNGAAGEAFHLPSVAELKGTLSFHVRETTCAFTNVVLRSALE